jgi:acetolactate synthase-1/2/3 large subunit
VAHDPPLASDIEAIARGASAWVRTVGSAADVAREAVAAVRAASGPPGAVATLVVPDDVQRAPADDELPPPASPVTALDAASIAAAADRLRGARTPIVLLGGPAVDARGLHAAARVCSVTGARLLVEQFPRNLRAEPGLPRPARLQYLPQMARPQLAEHDFVLLAGADPPVCFFGYPGEPPLLTPEQTAVVPLAAKDVDPRLALEALADALRASAPADPEPVGRPVAPEGTLGADTIAAAIAALLPDDAIVVDEGITASLPLYPALAGAAPHDYLACKGGAIGWSLPAATGAALAGRGRRVVTLVGDGSAAYTLQALWTQAREGLDVTTVVAVNHRYAILQLELLRAGGLVEGPGAALTAIDAPNLSWSALARGFGVPARRVNDAAECVAALQTSFATPGPMLIEALLP